MIQRNNNLSVLPFYEDIEEQNHRHSYAYGEKYPLYCPMGSVPPFQIIRNHYEHHYILAAWLINADDGSYTHIGTALGWAGMTLLQYPSEGYDIIVYPDHAPHNITVAEGRYYIQIAVEYNEDTPDSYMLYSDIFTVVADMSGFLNLEWWDAEDLVMDGSRIAYPEHYHNQLWLNTQLGKPEYEFEEEGENRDGYFYPEKMISQKKYKFVFLAPEYLCDVMRFIRLSDFVYIRDRYNNLYRCDTFLCTPKWEQQGDLASVEVEFTCETVAKKIGKGYLRLGQGADFNNDYNNDYDIENV